MPKPRRLTVVLPEAIAARLDDATRNILGLPRNLVVSMSVVLLLVRLAGLETISKREFLLTKIELIFEELMAEARRCV